MALDLCQNFVQNFVSAQYLKNKVKAFHQFCICIGIDKTCICIGIDKTVYALVLTIDSAEIKYEDNVTLLGINIDLMLRFYDHVSQICKKSFKATHSLEANWSFFN